MLNVGTFKKNINGYDNNIIPYKSLFFSYLTHKKKL